MTVKNHSGGSWFISKDLLARDAWSADHYDKEVKCTMTDLSEILESCQDTVFKVAFRKKIEQKHIEERLNEINFQDLQNATKLNKMTKAIVEGE